MILMKGNELKKIKLRELKNKLELLNTRPGLAVIQVDPNEASMVYTKSKEKLARDLNYTFKHIVLSNNLEENTLINVINTLNRDNDIDGIIVDMPLPKYMNKVRVVNSINPNKDVDGLTIMNAGKILSGNYGLIPSTPKSIVDLLKYYNVPVEGKNVVVIGRSLVVGKPIASILTNMNATVTLCHSKTLNLEWYTRNADIIVVAVGKKDFLRGYMVSDGVTIIDVGINSVDDKIYGDVNFLEVSKKASYITPVPGGVGPLTVYELMENVYNAHILKLNKR